VHEMAAPLPSLCVAEIGGVNLMILVAGGCWNVLGSTSVRRCHVRSKFPPK
jgi:hypothetical protein